MRTKESHAKYMREWRKKNKERHKRVKDKWNKKNREKCIAYSSKYNKNNNDKVRARRYIERAVRDGKIMRPTKCENCNSRGRLHGHHDDYEEPLKVRWLCPQCHRDVHRIKDKEADGE